MKPPLRIGLLGYGYMGTIRHRVLLERDDCELVRIFHTEPLTPELAELQAPTVEAVVDDPDLDAVVVCLPNHRTCELCCRALHSGKHVFAEKPPGRTVAELERMAAAEQGSGRVLKFGFNHRYHPAFLELQDRIASLGDLVWVRGRYGKPKETDFDDGWRARPDVAGGGILLDQGIHMLDLIRALCGGFDTVSAIASGAPLESELMAILGRDDGVVASLHSSQSQWPPLFSLQIGLTQGEITMDGLLSRSGRYGPERLRWRSQTGPTEERVYTVDDSWALEFDEFFGAISGGRPVSVGSTAEALDLMTLLASIYAAAGRPIALH